MTAKNRGNIAPNRGKKGADRPDVCVFCEVGAPSLEHVLPSWMKKYVAFGEGKFTEFSAPIPTKNIITGEVLAADALYSEFEFERRYDFTNLQVYGPCVKCNNEWMSRLEMEAELVFAPILRDERHSISAADQAVIAKWVTLRAIVSELGFPERTIFTPIRRRQFMTKPERFMTSRIFIARSANLTGKSILCSPNLMQDAAGTTKVPLALFGTFHFGPVVIVIFYAAEAILPGGPIFPVDIAPFPLPEYVHLLYELPATNAEPVGWPLPYRIHHPHPFEEIRNWFKTLMANRPN